MIAEDSPKRPRSIVDVGCGIGGSSRYLARKYDAKCQGITLSPVQAQRAQALAVAEGLADEVCFNVCEHCKTKTDVLVTFSFFSTSLRLLA